MVVLQNVRAWLGDQPAQQLRCVRRAEQARIGERVNGDRTARPHLILQRRLARCPHRIARDRDAGEGRLCVCAAQHVTDSAAPAVHRALGHRRLPHRLLVVVRKQLRRQRHRTVLILRTRRRPHQRSDVGDDRSASGVEQRGQRLQFRRQREFAAALICQRRQRQQRVARTSNAAARLLVSVVRRCVIRNHRVVIVVAAVQKDADDRLVVARGLRRRSAERGEIQRKRSAGAERCHAR